MLERRIYEDSIEGYQDRLSKDEERLRAFTPDRAISIDRKVTPFGISIVAGIPLFTTHDNQRDFNFIMHGLKSILPNQFIYGNEKTHIALSVLRRNGPLEISPTYIPEGNKGEFYRDYLDVFNAIQFEPFSLMARALYPPGIMIWEPYDNQEEIFRIRKQILMGLLDKRNDRDDFYFDTREGLPDIPNLIHTTFMRPYDLEELTRNFQKYLDFLQETNNSIIEGRLFSEPLKIDNIAFIESKVSSEISLADYYTDEVIERMYT